jgi:hypothetical protein
MSNILTNNLETKTYTLFLASADKVSGTNNSAVFNVNWDSFLPREYDTYKVTFSYQSGGGNYKDSSFSCSTSSQCASLVNNILTFTSANISASNFSGTVNVGQQLTISTSTPVSTKTYYITGRNSGTGSYLSSSSYYVTNNNESLSITNFSGNQVFSGVKIVMDLQGRSYSYDSSSSSPSVTLGYAQRDIQTGTSSSNSFSAFYLQFPPKTVSRPTQNTLRLSFYNLNYPTNLLTDTSALGNNSSDMTPWNIILEFIPCLSSKKPDSL